MNVAYNIIAREAFACVYYNLCYLFIVFNQLCDRGIEAHFATHSANFSGQCIGNHSSSAS